MTFKPEQTKLATKGDTDKTEKPRLTNTATALNRTSVDPVSVRFTTHERAELEHWKAELQQFLGKPLSTSQILRALVHMRKHVKIKRLVESIKENT